MPVLHSRNLIIMPKRYNNGYMSTEHLLLGILSQDTSTGARFLADEDVNLDQVEKLMNHTASKFPVRIWP